MRCARLQNARASFVSLLRAVDLGASDGFFVVVGIFGEPRSSCSIDADALPPPVRYVAYEFFGAPRNTCVCHIFMRFFAALLVCVVVRCIDVRTFQWKRHSVSLFVGISFILICVGASDALCIRNLFACF